MDSVSPSPAFRFRRISLDCPTILPSSLSPLSPEPHSAPSITTPAPARPAQTAAARFIAVPELRQLLFAALDNRSLAQWARVEKGLTYDVARELYRTVEMVVLRNRMSRVGDRQRIYRDAVRRVVVCENIETPNVLDRARRSKWTAQGFLPISGTTTPTIELSLREKCVLVGLAAIRQKCPGTREVVLLQDGTTIELGESIETGRLYTHRDWHVEGPPSNNNSNRDALMPPPHALPGFDGYERVYNSVNLIRGHVGKLKPEHIKTVPAPLRSLRVQCFCIGADELLALPTWLQNATGDTLGKMQSLSLLDPQYAPLDQIIPIIRTYSIAPLRTLILPGLSAPGRQLLSHTDWPFLIEALAEQTPNLTHLELGIDLTCVEGNTWHRVRLGQLKLKKLKVGLTALGKPKGEVLKMLYTFALVLDGTHSLTIERADGQVHAATDEKRCAGLMGWVKDFRTNIANTRHILDLTKYSFTSLGLFTRLDIPFLTCHPHHPFTPLHAIDTLIDRTFSDARLVEHVSQSAFAVLLRSVRATPLEDKQPACVARSIMRALRPAKGDEGYFERMWEGVEWKVGVRMRSSGVLRDLGDYVARWLAVVEKGAQ